MDVERWERIQSLFLATLEQDPGTRSAFLAAACHGDETLYGEVEAMLAAHPDSQGLAIEDALVVEDPSRHDPRVQLGTHVGPYRLVRHLGRGGMGDVYLAERDDGQYRNQVAVKLVRTDFGLHDLVGRFRAERQILARLIHPNIVPLLDGGVTGAGRPYLVMQYVEGVALTTYCNENRLSVAERLHLFRQVCEAVQLAHRNLVVHRDLKPSNILVSPVESDDTAPGRTAPGRVHLLDFSIAKLLDPEAAGVSAPVTRSEVRVMTPEYAAPEQFRGDAVTTATDVYALGVLLYELLAGHRPYRLANRSRAEIERVVCQEEPKPPSSAVTWTGELGGEAGTTATRTPDRVAAARRTSPGRLRKALRGDLDNIVMTALRKEPARRYASVEALHEDVLRFLTRRPVSARRDTLGYRLGKFASRHRGAVVAGALMVVLVLGFGVAMTVQAARLAQRGQALEEERDRVRRQVETTTRVKALVSDLFKWVDPNEVRGSPGERLQEASQRIVQNLAGEPEIQVELMDEVLTIYMNLGLYQAALEMAQASLAIRRATFGPREAALAWGMHRLGEAFFLNSRFTEAQKQYQEALDLQRAVLGDGHVDVARSLVRLSRVYSSLGRNVEAEACAVEARTLFLAAYGDADPRSAEALYQLAIVRKRRAGPEAAEPLFRDVLAVRREVLGNDHPDVASTLTALGLVIMEQERLAAAAPFLEEALAIQRSRYGDDHPQVSHTRLQLGRLHEEKRELVEAEGLYRQALTARRRRLGSRHVATAAAMIRLGGVLTQQGAYGEAEALLLEALPIYRSMLGLDHQRSRSAVQALTTLYEAWGRTDEAAVVHRLLVEARSSAPSPE